VCEPAVETEVCSTQSCDSDCVLEGHWSPWSECSRACNGGVQHAVKAVAHPTVGSGGKCPAHHSSQRLKYRKCNTHVSCPVSGIAGETKTYSTKLSADVMEKSFLKCNSLVDV